MVYQPFGPVKTFPFATAILILHLPVLKSASLLQYGRFFDGAK